MKPAVIIFRKGPAMVHPGTDVPITIGPASTSPDDPTRQVFDGFPYLVERFAPAAYLVHPVPAALPREQLIALAREQAAASGLPTCLAFGLRDGVYCEPDGSIVARDGIPRGGKQLLGRALIGPRLPVDAETEARLERLEAYLAERDRRARGDCRLSPRTGAP